MHTAHGLRPSGEVGTVLRFQWVTNPPHVTLAPGPRALADKQGHACLCETRMGCPPERAFCVTPLEGVSVPWVSGTPAPEAASHSWAQGAPELYSSSKNQCRRIPLTGY